MKKIFIYVIILLIIFLFVNCVPEYAKVRSIESVYKMAIDEIEGEVTMEKKSLAFMRVQNKILKAQIWYYKNDPNNPRIKELQEMNELFKD